MRCLILTQSSQKEQHTSLQDATALCKGVNHLLSLALTLAPVKKNKNNRNLKYIYRMIEIFSRTEIELLEVTYSRHFFAFFHAKQLKGIFSPAEVTKSSLRKYF